MTRMNDRERQILWIFAVCIALLAADQAIITPLTNHWRNVHEAFVRKESELDHDRQLLSHAAAIREEFSRLKSRGSSEKVSVLRDIETVARRNGIRISDLKPENQEGDSAKVGEVVFFSLESSWDSLMRFLYDLQSSSDGLDIQKAVIQRKGEYDGVLISQIVVGRR